MRQKHLDLGLALLIALLNVGWAFLPANQPMIQVVRVLLALPLVLFLPGYMLTQIVFYRRSPDFIFLLALWPGLSIAIAIIGGLVLNALPSGLQGTSWSIFLALITTTFALIAGILRNTVLPLPDQREHFTRSHLPFYSILLFSVAIVIVTFSYVYAARGEAQQPHPGFTQMWMLPTIEATNSCAVHLGFSNFEGKTMTYRATVTVGKDQQYTWSHVVLATQGTWNQQVTIRPISSTRMQDTQVAAQLYRQDVPQKPYRQVHLTLTTCKS